MKSSFPLTIFKNLSFLTPSAPTFDEYVFILALTVSIVFILIPAPNLNGTTAMWIFSNTSLRFSTYPKYITLLVFIFLIFFSKPEPTI